MAEQQEQKELFALAAWLQTFPEFGIQLYTGKEGPSDVEQLTSVLNSTEASLYVLSERTN